MLRQGFVQDIFNTNVFDQRFDIGFSKLIIFFKSVDQFLGEFFRCSGSPGKKLGFQRHFVSDNIVHQEVISDQGQTDYRVGDSGALQKRGDQVATPNFQARFRYGTLQLLLGRLVTLFKVVINILVDLIEDIRSNRPFHRRNHGFKNLFLDMGFCRLLSTVFHIHPGKPHGILNTIEQRGIAPLCLG